MSTLDWAVVTLYATGLILLSVYLSKGQTSAKDYYLGGRTFVRITIIHITIIHITIPRYGD